MRDRTLERGRERTDLPHIPPFDQVIRRFLSSLSLRRKIIVPLSHTCAGGLSRRRSDEDDPLRRVWTLWRTKKTGELVNFWFLRENDRGIDCTTGYE